MVNERTTGSRHKDRLPPEEPEHSPTIESELDRQEDAWPEEDEEVLGNGSAEEGEEEVPRHRRRRRHHHSRPRTALERLLQPHALRVNRLTKKSKLFLLRRFLVIISPMVVLGCLALLPVINSSFLWLDRQRFAMEKLSYEPLMWAMHWLQALVWGIGGARGCHFFTVLFHLASAVLLWRILKRLHISGAWGVGAVFAVHPAFTPAVAWIAQQGTVMATTWLLAALLAFLNYDTKREDDYYRLAFLFAAMSLLTSPAVGFAMPFGCLALIWWKRAYRNGLTAAHIQRCLPFLILVATYLVMVLAASIFMGHYKQPGPGLITRLGESGFVAWRGILNLLLPSQQTLFYPVYAAELSLFVAFVPLLLVLLVLALFWHGRHVDAWRAAYLCLLSSAVMVLPVVFVRGYGMQEYSVVGAYVTYAASIPVLILAVTGVASLLSRSGGLRDALQLGAAVTVLFGFSTWSFVRNRTYQAPAKLWAKTAEAAPQSVVAYHELGRIYASEDRYELASEALKTARELAPDNGEIHELLLKVYEYLGILGESGLLEEMGQPVAKTIAASNEAEADYRPDYAPLVTENVRSREGKVALFLNLPETKTKIDEIIQYDEKYFRYNESAAATFLQDAYQAYLRGDLNTAAELAWKAAETDHESALPDYILSQVYLKRNQPDKAAVSLQLALEKNPRLVGARYIAGRMLVAAGRYAEAVSNFNAALTLDPECIEAHMALAQIRLLQGLTLPAFNHYATVIHLRKDYIPALEQLARLLACFPEEELRDGRRAVEYAERASILAGYRDPFVLDTLAAAYAESGNFKEAERVQKRAIELLQDKTSNAVVTPMAAGFEVRLKLYQNRQPYRFSEFGEPVSNMP